MQLLMRILIGIIGTLAVLLALRIWADPAAVGAQFGLAAKSPLGLATIRADMGGFFAAAGILALTAVILRRGEFLLAPMLLVGLALAGRFVTVLADGFAAPMAPPMLVEAVLLSLFFAGWRVLPRRSSNQS